MSAKVCTQDCEGYRLGAAIPHTHPEPVTAASGADQPTIRDQLIAVLRPVLLTRVAEDRADALLPLIEAREERAKAEGGAEALQDAADDIPANAEAPEAKQILRDRAAALRAITGQPPDGGDVR